MGWIEFRVNIREEFVVCFYFRPDIAIRSVRYEEDCLKPGELMLI